MNVTLLGGDPRNAILLNGVLKTARRGGEIGVPGFGHKMNLLPVAGAHRMG